jgi:cytochrome c-type biogenesis protein CcmH
MSLQPVFWAIALTLLALTLVALLLPLLRRAPGAPSEEAARTAVYRDHRRQLDEELAAGTITPAEHADGLAELATRLGSELDAAAQNAAAAGSEPRRISERSRFMVALVAVAVIPAAAIVLYLALGNPEALRAPPAMTARPTQEQVIAMVETLAQKMKANPSDPKGWRLLGRSYAALGRFRDSADAYAQAVQHGADDAAAYADWAEALALAHNDMRGEPEALARKALDRDANSVKALALLATAAYERKDYDTAIATWRRVQAALPPGSEDAAQAANAIAQIEQARAGASAGTGSASPPEAGGTGGMSAAAPNGGGASPAASNGARGATAPSATAITGHVAVAPALAGRIAPADTLFVFARPSDGPRMPLAILRRSGADLPLDFRLDDSMGMGAGPPLSSARQVVVEARVSKSGRAAPQPGDLVGRSVPVKPGASGVRITLDEVVK